MPLKTSRSEGAGAPTHRECEDRGHLTFVLPLTVNFQVPGWLPVVRVFWSSGLPDSSVAAIVTVAM